ncbi:phenylacetate--CoA ligase family protein [Salinimicrobium xinjiangense]|uniref:phenylacetate--CoA ligase family protein n=1 Tax=Salinimicrobium xinjiangense TaxID=438596 RepID=UPI000490C27B|nr:phenylacetate--CoA ligase family protein [Salinimicrobium xinjiangense]
MRKTLSKTVGYPLQDKVKGTKILETLNFLRDSQSWDQDRIRNYQNEKLKSLVNHAYKNVPFYRDTFNELKLSPSDIKTQDDLYKIPVLTKEIARRENHRLLVKNHSSLGKIKKGKTGGTTGSPLLIYKDVTDRSFTWASYYRWFEWMGINYYDKKSTLWGAKTVLSQSTKSKFKDKATNFLLNEKTVNTFDNNEKNWKKTYDEISRFQPSILKGYLSSLIEFAHFIEKNNLNTLKPEVLSSTTETLLPHNREFLQKIFKAPIFDQYGCGEINGIAYECSAHDGLHITEEHCIVEIQNNGSNVIQGESGNLVITNLDNYVMPVIRYENGDRSSLSTKKCSCGINHSRLNSIEGRTADTIVLKNDVHVHAVFFTDIFYELGIFTDKVQRFQVIQTKVGQIILKLECQKNLEDHKEKQLRIALKRFFSNVEILQVVKIENSKNGKFRNIINEVSKTGK